MRKPGLACTLLLVAACAEAPPPDPARIAGGRADLGHEIARQRCVICHRIGERGGVIGPAMPEAAHKAAERAAGFEAVVAELEAKRADHRETKRAKIDPILAEPDPERRLRLWLATYLVDPQFDNPANRMTALPLTENERANVIAWLLSLSRSAGGE